MNKYYAYWYSGPQHAVPDQYDGKFKEADQCGYAYFGGVVEKYQNILEGSCFDKKCTACEIKNSLLETSKLTLRGLCRYSAFDTTYTVQNSMDSVVFYVGVERTIISYNFTLNIWTMRDVTNPSVTAVSEASLRSLAIGNILWTITNDTTCRQGLNKTANISDLMSLPVTAGSHSKVLSLTSCSSHQFTCNDGLCIDLQRR